MDEKIKRLKSTTFLGRRFRRAQLALMQETVALFPALSRKQLALAICENLEWYTGSGTHAYQACLQVLVKLEALGILQLPPKAPGPTRGACKPLQWSEASAEAAPVVADLQALQPLQLQLVTTESERRLWNEYIDRYHYLGYKHPMGANLRYWMVDAQGRHLACLGFSYAVPRLTCRD